MIKLHHLDNSRSQRVLWLLEELALPYEVVQYKRDPKTMLAPQELCRIHPLGKSPVLEDDDVPAGAVVDGQASLVIAESAAIIEYLVERYDPGHRLWPSPTPAFSPERMRYRYWMHYSEGSVMPPLLLGLVFSRLKQAPMPFFARPVARGIAGKALTGFVNPQIKLHMDYIEAELDQHPWFAGDRFTAADIQMSFPVEAGDVRGAGKRPNVAAFLERIHARPAYQQALERGGPFSVDR